MSRNKISIAGPMLTVESIEKERVIRVIKFSLEWKDPPGTFPH